MISWSMLNEGKSHLVVMDDVLAQGGAIHSRLWTAVSNVVTKSPHMIDAQRPRGLGIMTIWPCESEVTHPF